MATAVNPTAVDELVSSHAAETAHFDRIARIRDEMLDTAYSVCLERPALLRAFRRSGQGRRSKKDHPLVRRAKALAHVMSHRRPRVYDHELIIGNMTGRRIAANYYPEGGSVNILEDVFRLERRAIPIKLSGSEKIRLVAMGLGNLHRSIGGKALLRPGRTKHFLDFFRARRYFVTEEAGVSHQVGGYGQVVRHGLKRADEAAQRCLDQDALPDGSPLNDDQRAFYRSIRITIDGLKAMAANLADEAERLAGEAGLSPGRAAELLESARACRRVPYGPARTFVEGLQACWLVHVALNLEDFEQGLSFGRLDQILLPLYLADLEAGRLTPERAVEFLASFMLKTGETMPLYSQRIDQYFSGNGVAQGITIGGTDTGGADATNELSGLILDAYALVKTREPALHARVHADSPPWFLDKCSEVIQLGCGKPSLFSDPAVVRALERAGFTTEHARDYAIIGCVETASQGRTYNSSDACLFNLPLCLELALNQGQQWSGKRVGPATKSVHQMTCFEDVVEAFRIQVADAVKEAVQVITWLEEVYRIHRPTPVNSMITSGCLARGRDVTWGGADYDFTSIQAVGLADAGDSLAALDQAVFVHQRLSLVELAEVLRSNFEGHEFLRAWLERKTSRYGNGDKEADQYTQLAADVFADAVAAHGNSRGGRYIPGYYSMTCHLGFGRKTGALPNGRPAGHRLSNGLSPVDGADRRGPTAVLRSAAGLDSRKWTNCCALNMKFDQKTIAGPAGGRALAGLIKTFVQTGGMQVQFNVLDADMLRQAQADPNAYPGLVVRVAGYCAYFNDLQPEVQDEIIERTAHGRG
jgi:formate C-acetyltransferase